MEASASAGAGGSLCGSGQELELDAVAVEAIETKIALVLFKCVETSGK